MRAATATSLSFGNPKVESVEARAGINTAGRDPRGSNIDAERPKGEGGSSGGTDEEFGRLLSALGSGGMGGEAGCDCCAVNDSEVMGTGAGGSGGAGAGLVFLRSTPFGGGGIGGIGGEVDDRLAKESGPFCCSPERTDRKMTGGSSESGGRTGAGRFGAGGIASFPSSPRTDPV